MLRGQLALPAINEIHPLDVAVRALLDAVSTIQSDDSGDPGRQGKRHPRMYKLIVVLVAAIPIVLFLRTVFGRSKVVKGAAADLKRHIDYLVWAILFVIGCTLLYAAAKVAYTLWQ
jgi:hypothetical protein